MQLVLFGDKGLFHNLITLFKREPETCFLRLLPVLGVNKTTNKAELYSIEVWKPLSVFVREFNHVNAEVIHSSLVTVLSLSGERSNSKAIGSIMMISLDFDSSIIVPYVAVLAVTYALVNSISDVVGHDRTDFMGPIPKAKFSGNKHLNLVLLAAADVIHIAFIVEVTLAVYPMQVFIRILSCRGDNAVVLTEFKVILVLESVDGSCQNEKLSMFVFLLAKQIPCRSEKRFGNRAQRLGVKPGSLALNYHQQYISTISSSLRSLRTPEAQSRTSFTSS